MQDHDQTARPVILSPAVCWWLEHHLDLSRLRAAHRGENPDVDRALLCIRLSAISHQASCGTETRHSGPPINTTPCQWIGVQAAAQRIGITPQAVRRAAATGRLPAHRVAGRWLLDPDDVDAYAARRRHTTSP